MKFILAPDSYKESATALEVAQAMESGIKRVFPESECVLLPIADGGEGTLAALEHVLDGSIITVDVLQANHVIAPANYLLLTDGTAIIEMAQSSGLQQVPMAERNPFKATSYGTGQLIQHALTQGARKICIGLGGSACNDGGAGMLQALGAELLTADGTTLDLGNAALEQLTTISFAKLHPQIKTTPIAIISDVTNPLCGPTGATFTFGPQKGATPENLACLEANLAHFATVAETTIGKTVQHQAGSGAAGGLGFALYLLNDLVTMHQGVDYILDLIEFETKIQGADLVLTGEGATDFQTAYGKAPSGVAKRAKELGIPTIILSGSVTGDLTSLYEIGVTSVHSVLHQVSSLKEAIANAKTNITYTTETVIRTRFK